MEQLALLEKCYEEFSRKLQDLRFENLLEIDINLLSSMNLLTTDSTLVDSTSEHLQRYFTVFESKEKITLYNNEFAIWIVPEFGNVTHAYIAINKKPVPELELVLYARGIYNNSSLIIQSLEKLLKEIHENELLINYYEQHNL